MSEREEVKELPTELNETVDRHRTGIYRFCPVCNASTEKPCGFVNSIFDHSHIMFFHEDLMKP